MDNSLISVRYAKALFLLSQEKKIMESVYNDMLILHEQCISTPEFSDLLDSPVLSPTEKIKTLKSIFEKYVSDITLNFLSVIVENNREGLLSIITRNYLDFYKQQIGLKTVTLYVAFELNESYKIVIKEMLEKELKGKIELNVSVRSHLIGGFVLMVDGKMMDASIFNKLKVLKNKLLS